MRSIYSIFIILFSLFSLAPLASAQQDDAAVAELLGLLEEVEENEGEEPAPTGEDTHDAASDILDDMEDDKWSWSGDEDITIDSTTDTCAVIRTTQVTYDGTPVEKYKVYYSDRTLATFQDYESIQDVSLSPMRTQGTSVFLNVCVLSPEQTYYVVVAPVHPTDPTVEPLTMISDEEVFTTKRKSVSGSAKIFNNVSYTYTDGSVTLTWAPSTEAANAEIHLRHQSEGAYTKIGSPAIKDGKFTFSVDKSGNYFLKMIGLDGSGKAVGKEHIQTVKIDEVEAPVATTKKPVQTAPQVGPATDMIIGLLALAFIMYFVYRFRRIER